MCALRHQLQIKNKQWFHLEEETQTTLQFFLRRILFAYGPKQPTPSHPRRRGGGGPRRGGGRGGGGGGLQETLGCERRQRRQTNFLA